MPRHAPSSSTTLNNEGARRFFRDCAAALRSCQPGKAALYLGGQALLNTGETKFRMKWY